MSLNVRGWIYQLMKWRPLRTVWCLRPLPDWSLLPALVRVLAASGWAGSEVCPEVTDFHLGSHTNTFQRLGLLHGISSHYQMKSEGQGPSVSQSLPIQSGFFSLLWRSPYINRTGSGQTHGHFPLATYKYLSCKVCSFVYSPNSYYWESIGLESPWDVRLAGPQFPHL